MAKAELLIKVNGRRGFGIRLKIEPMRAHATSFLDAEQEKRAADAGAAGRFSDGHLGELEFAGSNGNERAAADGLSIAFGNGDLTAGIEDVPLRVADDGQVGGLHREVFADPGLVKVQKGGFVAGAKRAADDGVRVRLGHGQKISNAGRAPRAELQRAVTRRR